jgi:hypothetical protein
MENTNNIDQQIYSKGIKSLKGNVSVEKSMINNSMNNTSMINNRGNTNRGNNNNRLF